MLNQIGIPGHIPLNAACINGWRRNSTGYYVIDRQRFKMFGNGPWPVRLLLMQPPQSPKHRRQR